METSSNSFRWAEYATRERGQKSQPAGRSDEQLDRKQVAGTRVAGRVTQLRHRTSFDLANALTCEVEMLTNLFKRAGFATIKTEPQFQNLALAFIEWCEQT